MATSGTYTFAMTIGTFLDNVLSLAGVLAEGESASAVHYDKGIETLNLQQHQLEVNDLPIWKRDFYEFAPTASSFVTNDSVQYRCVKGHTSVAADEPGTGDLWEQYWVADADTTVSPTAWALSTAYVTSIEVTVPARFYDVLIATVIQNSSNEIPMDIIPFEQYTRDTFSKRTSLAASVPYAMAFDNNLTNTGFLYPQPTNAMDSTFRIYGVVKPEDATGTGEDMDIPPRYLNMLRFNVALDLAYQYQRDAETIQLLTRQASYYNDQYRKSNIEQTTDNYAQGAY